MEITYRLTAEDFLEFNLYTAYYSEEVKKREFRGMMFLLVFILIMSVYLVIDKQYLMLAFPAILIVAILFFYRKYYRWRLKKGYVKYIQAAHQEQLEKEETLVIKSNSIFVKNALGEGSISKTELISLTESKNLFMLLMKSGSSIVIPKSELKNADRVSAEFKKIGVSYKEDLDWEWK